MTTTTRILAAVLVLAATVTLAGASDHGWRRGEREEEEHGSRDRRDERDGRRDGAARTAVPASAAAAEPGAAALYRKECGACHLAFTPGFLPAESHRRTLAGLEKHFGQNAELDDASRATLERYLVDHAADAGTHRKSAKILASLGGTAPLRVTEVPYFQRKHRKIGADVVARPAVKTLSNCAACHPRAADWDFDEDRVKIPR